MRRREFLIGSAALVPRRRPNVVFVMTDDHGAWATGCYGCGDIRTPNLDRLAAEGTRFTRAFACTPVCSPSRMSYLTGLIPSQHGVQDYLLREDAGHRFLEGHTTYSEILARHGYTLGMCGKWHMGGDAEPQAGFTYWCTVPGGGGTYRDPEFVRNGVRARVTGYKTDLVGDCALDFIERNKDRTFFLQVPFFAPHTPYDYQPEVYRRPYYGSRFGCFPDLPRNPAQNPELNSAWGKPESKLAYSALVTGVDTNVGRILTRLEELGLRENTLVIFTADQGWSAGHHGVWGKGNGTVPFNMYEEALRVPLIWNFPGRIRGGQTIPAMVSSYDFFPTILDYLGAPAPRAGSRPGRSYAPFLRGAHPRWRDRLYFEYAYVRGIRTENVKYIQRTDGWPSEFYDLEADPAEARNALADPVYREEIRSLGTDLDRFFRDHGAPEIGRWRSTTRQQLHVYPCTGPSQQGCRPLPEVHRQVEHH
ncbi:MAG: sulfatase-like hydrolase/transferase [Acidobacteria bacterium]|nr:sulfatase-like hydrolase/transferase [Acidobacteriota bacterium]